MIVSVPAITHSMLVVSRAEERRIAQAVAAVAAATTRASASTSGRRRRVASSWLRRRPNGSSVTPARSSSQPAGPKTAAASGSDTRASRRSDSIELRPLMLLTSGESDLGRWQGVAQPFACAVQAEPHDGAARAERDGELLSRQALPGDE